MASTIAIRQQIIRYLQKHPGRTTTEVAKACHPDLDCAPASYKGWARRHLQAMERQGHVRYEDDDWPKWFAVKDVECCVCPKCGDVHKCSEVEESAKSEQPLDPNRKIKCTKCDGRGKVVLPANPDRRTFLPERRKCCLCEGTGELPVDKA